jgi:uncharacterized protein
VKSAATLVLALAALLAGALAWAQAPAPVPPYKARVVDLTGTLSAAQAQALEGSLREFEQRKGSQIAVLIVPTVRPESIEQYSIRVAEAWKSGRRNVDDGLIVVVAKNDREARIEVGRGLEGVVPDIIASRVIREIITPRFQAGDFYGGLSQATQALMKRIEGEPLPAPERRGGPGARGAPDFQGTFVILLILAFVGGGILSRLLGRGGGALGTGGIVGVVAWILTGTLIVGAIAGAVALLFTLAGGGGGLARHRGGWGGGWGGGGWGGGGGFGGGGGGFGGGGGSFGGGGASGRW